MVVAAFVLHLLVFQARELKEPPRAWRPAASSDFEKSRVFIWTAVGLAADAAGAAGRTVTGHKNRSDDQ